MYEYEDEINIRAHYTEKGRTYALNKLSDAIEMYNFLKTYELAKESGFFSFGDDHLTKEERILIYDALKAHLLGTSRQLLEHHEKTR